MFAFNVTGEVDEMRRRHDLVLELGGTCVMVKTIKSPFPLWKGP